MAKYGWPDLVIKFDITDGGALQDMSSHVTTINGVDKERILEEQTPATTAFETWLYTGMQRMGEITLGGPYDDTASTGPNAVFNGTHTATRTLEVTYGSTKKTTVETWIKNFRRIVVKEGTTKYEVVLQPTGTITEA